MTDPRPRGPVLIEVEEAPPLARGAPPVPNGSGRPPAMERAMRSPRPRSRLGAGSGRSWGASCSSRCRSPPGTGSRTSSSGTLLGGVATALLSGSVALAIAGRERWRSAACRIDRSSARPRALAARRTGPGGRGRLGRSTRGARGCAGARRGWPSGRAEVFDADGLLRLAEAELLAPLDAAAEREVAGGGAAGGHGDGGGAAAPRRRGGGAGVEPPDDPAGGRDLRRAVGRRRVLAARADGDDASGGDRRGGGGRRPDPRGRRRHGAVAAVAPLRRGRGERRAHRPGRRSPPSRSAGPCPSWAARGRP